MSMTTFRMCLVPDRGPTRKTLLISIPVSVLRSRRSFTLRLSYTALHYCRISRPWNMTAMSSASEEPIHFSILKFCRLTPCDFCRSGYFIFQDKKNPPHLEPPIIMPDTGEVQLHFLDYWRVVKNRWGIITLTFLLVVVTAYITSYFLPREYYSKVTMEVETDDLQPDRTFSIKEEFNPPGDSRLSRPSSRSFRARKCSTL